MIICSDNVLNTSASWIGRVEILKNRKKKFILLKVVTILLKNNSDFANSNFFYDMIIIGSIEPNRGCVLLDNALSKGPFDPLLNSLTRGLW